MTILDEVVQGNWWPALPDHFALTCFKLHYSMLYKSTCPIRRINRVTWGTPANNYQAQHKSWGKVYKAELDTTYKWKWLI